MTLRFNGFWSFFRFQQGAAIRYSISYVPDHATSLVQVIGRLQTIRNLGVTLPAITPVSDTRIAALARYASTAKTTALQRLPEKRKLATLVAFSCCMEAAAQDDALELL